MRSLLLLTLLVLIGLTMIQPPSADAAEPAPGLTIASYAEPTNFSAGDNERCLLSGESKSCDSYTVTVTNAGAAATNGTAVTIADTLPPGLVLQKVTMFWKGIRLDEQCTTVPLQCVFPAFFGPLAPDERLTMVVYVTTPPGTAGPLLNRATVSGGGAGTLTTAEGPGFENPVSSHLPAFGTSGLGFLIAGANGKVDTQAGDHPYELTTTIGLRSAISRLPETGEVEPRSVEDLKDFMLDLPLGFVGSQLAAPQCTLAQLSSTEFCPPDTQVGEIETEPRELISDVKSPIWNMVPERGAPAEFGYRDTLKGAHIFYAHVVPSPHGYVLRTSAIDIPQVSLTQIRVTFFGDPSAKHEEIARREGKEVREGEPVPFFTNPTNCSGEPLRAVAHLDSWQHPARFKPNGEPDLSDPNWSEAVAESPPVTGCNALAFSPSLTAQPTTFQADTPSGLNFAIQQLQSETVGTLATATLKKAVVKLPLGMTVNPSAANGLAACSEAQIGWTGPSPAAFNPEPQQCPEASKIGSLELTSPLIAHKLTGAIYLAAQNENPFGSTLAGYVVVDDPITGVLIKIAGQLFSDAATGQITGVFDENPNLPFSDLKLSFFGGPRAELATPEACGSYSTTTELTPWSLEGEESPATPFDAFQVNSGCVGAFNPAFTALSSNVQAGAFTPFLASFSREDSDQELGGLSLSLPPGLLASVASVPECPDAQASAGTCPESTRVGTVQAFAGPGPNPLSVMGRAYWTGPYKGAPFGLSVVVPAVAGPFNFGTVTVRQALYIDPSDAHATVVSDPFPTFLHPLGANGQVSGIPIKLRRVDVSIDRPGFTFNPTNCSKLQVGGTISSTAGAGSSLATPFQVTNCQSLKFTPKLTVTTKRRASRQNGQSLAFRIAYPKGAMGSQAWFNEARFELPKQLPARLPTLHQACLAATFAHDRAACPAHSIIGHAVVHTPILPVALEGPVYFVSYGGAAFPDAVLVLDGDGIRIELHGNTFIDHKTGVTSATFRNTPDTPFESIEVTLPAGPYSEFGANLPHESYDFCGRNLIMPTLFKASNGLEIKQNTKVSVTGCPKAKKHKKAHKSRHHGKKASTRANATRRSHR